MKLPEVATLALAVTAATAGCSGSSTQDWYGQVTTLTPRLCVGRHAATGDCFTGGPTDQTAKVKVGDCVHVVFKPRAKNAPPGPLQLVSIKSATASDHRDDCP